MPTSQYSRYVRKTSLSVSGLEQRSCWEANHDGAEPRRLLLGGGGCASPPDSCRRAGGEETTPPPFRKDAEAFA